MSKPLGFSAAIFAAFIVSVLPGCDAGSTASNLNGSKSDSVPAVQGAPNESVRPVSSTELPKLTKDKLVIASFNIQVFGQSKGNDPWVMMKLAEIIQQFDIVAVQEIRSIDQRLIPTLLEYVNQNGLKYDFVISSRLGRTSSKEQYAFIYDSTRLFTSPDEAFVVNDQPQDMLHREPFVARFVTRVPAGVNPFQFVLINMHTDPDEVDQELNVLDDVYKNVRQFEYPEDDIILLGDLNVERSQFQDLGQIPGVDTVIRGVKSNSRQTRLIDHIVIDRYATTEFTGRSGVLDLTSFFQIQLSDAERISDHFPVWAEFSIVESTSQPAAFAQQPDDVTVR